MDNSLKASLIPMELDKPTINITNYRVFVCDNCHKLEYKNVPELLKLSASNITSGHYVLPACSKASHTLRSEQFQFYLNHKLLVVIDIVYNTPNSQWK